MSANKSLPATRVGGAKANAARIARTEPARAERDAANSPARSASGPDAGPSGPRMSQARGDRPLPRESGTRTAPVSDEDDHQRPRGAGSSKPSAAKAAGKVTPRLPDTENDPRVPTSHAAESAAARKGRRNYEMPISMGPATLAPGPDPVVPVGLGNERRGPRLFPPEEPEPPYRDADPSQPSAPWLKSDPAELADNAQETMAAKEQADSPEMGSDSPGTQQDQ